MTVLYTALLIMSELTNLTDRLAHLRDRKPSSSGKKLSPKVVKKQRQRERTFATNYFGIFTYSLLAIALFTQFTLIIYFDLY